jgi:hypothetical protein
MFEFEVSEEEYELLLEGFLAGRKARRRHYMAELRRLKSLEKFLLSEAPPRREVSPDDYVGDYYFEGSLDRALSGGRHV